ncbi:unnamed protein product [Phytophthora fragariaefolia]|uniref:Unnamed protein product n=1 Tax=Phytophthora fragariaefolia TaxID=1490495 RepID=A0A9W6XEE9_9STRA|nr:unnamed protein product [Phytophthora fragariaefolia]
MFAVRRRGSCDRDAGAFRDARVVSSSRLSVWTWLRRLEMSISRFSTSRTKSEPHLCDGSVPLPLDFRYLLDPVAGLELLVALEPQHFVLKLDHRSGAIVFRQLALDPMVLSSHLPEKRHRSKRPEDQLLGVELGEASLALHREILKLTRQFSRSQRGLTGIQDEVSDDIVINEEIVQDRQPRGPQALHLHERLQTTKAILKEGPPIVVAFRRRNANNSDGEVRRLARRDFHHRRHSRGGPYPDGSKPSVWRALARSTLIAWGPVVLPTSVSGGGLSETGPDGLDEGEGARYWASEFGDTSFDPGGCPSTSSSSLASLELRPSLRAGGTELTLGAAEPPPDGVPLAAFTGKQQPSFCALHGKSRFDGFSEKDASDTRPVILLVDKKWAEKGRPPPQVVLQCRHPECSGVWTSSFV